MGLISNFMNKLDELVNEKAPSTEALVAMTKAQENAYSFDLDKGILIGAVSKNVIAEVGSVGELRTAEVGNKITDRVKNELESLNLDLLREAGMTDLANESVAANAAGASSSKTTEIT